MTQTKSAAVIGAGPAGLAAAQILSRYNIHVRIFEKSDHVLGKTFGFCCKATDRCLQCGVCHANLLFAELSQCPLIRIHFNSEVVNVSLSGSRFDVAVLSEGNLTRCLNFNYLVWAGGFNIYDPRNKPALRYGLHPDILSAETLEKTFIGQTDLKRPSTGEPAHKIAFIQCVGSRDRKFGMNYCSRVCCQYALRLAHFISYHNPLIKISFFYIDLQTPTDNLRKLATSNNPSIRFIRSIPGSITDTDDNHLELTYDDPYKNSQATDVFDLVVLSVGVMPVKMNMPEFDRIPLDRTDTGFFESSHTLPGFCAVGTSCGPMSILESIHHARVSILEILR